MEMKSSEIWEDGLNTEIFWTADIMLLSLSRTLNAVTSPCDQWLAIDASALLTLVSFCSIWPYTWLKFLSLYGEPFAVFGSTCVLRMPSWVHIGCLLQDSFPWGIHRVVAARRLVRTRDLMIRLFYELLRMTWSRILSISTIWSQDSSCLLVWICPAYEMLFLDGRMVSFLTARLCQHRLEVAPPSASAMIALTIAHQFSPKFETLYPGHRQVLDLWSDHLLFRPHIYNFRSYTRTE